MMQLLFAFFFFFLAVQCFTSLFLELYSTCHLTHYSGGKKLAFSVLLLLGVHILLLCHSHL